MPGSARTERGEKKVCACHGNTEIQMGEDSETLQARLKAEGNRAKVLQQRTSILFKQLDDLSRRRDDALQLLNKKKMELELRNNEIDLIKTDVQKLRSDINEKEARAHSLESTMKEASDQFCSVASTVKHLAQSAARHDRRTIASLRSGELAATRGYNSSI